MRLFMVNAYRVTVQGDSIPPPSPTAATALWDRVVGAELEELLYGLLDALGAKELTWRAGTARGVTAADDGRDIEALFDRPTPDGELERQRWWVESKGRSGTVDKRDVIAAVHDAAGREGVDFFVFCTNSRFSNPTRDWVAEWQRSHPVPRVRLWDRDRLARLVREHPTVAARVLPAALDDAQRLALLLSRFRELGETPTEEDLDYYWQRRDAIQLLEIEDTVGALAMFAYAEGDEGLTERPWATLVGDDPEVLRCAVLCAVVELPILQLRPLVRPLDQVRGTATSAYLLIAAIDKLDQGDLYHLLTEPWNFIDGPLAASLAQSDVSSAWRVILTAIVERVQAELEDACSDDCPRVSSEPNVFPSRLVGKRYWLRFGIGASETRRLIMEIHDKPCVVGLPLDTVRTCPLLRDPELTLERISDLQRIVEFRKRNPDDQYFLHVPRPTIPLLDLS
jgi:hypothetical protein